MRPMLAEFLLSELSPQERTCRTKIIPCLSLSASQQASYPRKGAAVASVAKTGEGAGDLIMSGAREVQAFTYVTTPKEAPLDAKPSAPAKFKHAFKFAPRIRVYHQEFGESNHQNSASRHGDTPPCSLLCFCCGCGSRGTYTNCENLGIDVRPLTPAEYNGPYRTQ
jgi:hypothetical protein